MVAERLAAGRVEAVELDAARPALPPVDRLFEPAVQIDRVGTAGAGGLELVRRQVLEREADPLTRPDLEPGEEVVVVGALQVDVASHQQAVVAADGRVGAHPAAPQPRLHFAVVEADRRQERELQPAAEAFHHPQELAVGPLGAALAHGEAVEDPCLAGGAADGRLQHQAVAEVAARGDRLGAGLDGAVAAAVGVEEAAEDAGRVDPGHAAPVD
jgi:hypothetical protein